jgi:hypothetical protein
MRLIAFISLQISPGYSTANGILNLRCHNATSNSIIKTQRRSIKIPFVLIFAMVMLCEPELALLNKVSYQRILTVKETVQDQSKP